MNIIFISNYLSEHQIELCRCLYTATEQKFFFLQTEHFSEERKKLGWKNYAETEPFFIDATDKMGPHVVNCIVNADVIICGGHSIDVYKYSLKKNVLILYYSERLFKKSSKIGILQFLKLIYLYRFKGRKYKTALLCASAYASHDYARVGAFKGRSFKWGYFPPLKKYSIESLMVQKESEVVNILWVGRIIDWKRTIDVLALAEKLEEDKKNYRVKIIGTGNLEQEIFEEIKRKSLQDHVVMLGALPQEEVRKHMEEANILIATSDYNEGWGAVINEGMNSGCVVVASHAMGAAPFLIENGRNGFIYPCGDINSLYKIVDRCITDNKMCANIGREAYRTIKEVWNAENATEQLLKLITYLNGGEDIQSDYICSIASRLENDWFLKENNKE